MILLLCGKSTFIRAEAFDREIKEGNFSQIRNKNSTLGKDVLGAKKDDK